MRSDYETVGVSDVYPRKRITVRQMPNGSFVAWLGSEPLGQVSVYQGAMPYKGPKLLHAALEFGPIKAFGQPVSAEEAERLPEWLREEHPSLFVET